MERQGWNPYNRDNYIWKKNTFRTENSRIWLRECDNVLCRKLCTDHTGTHWITQDIDYGEPLAICLKQTWNWDLFGNHGSSSNSSNQALQVFIHHHILFLAWIFLPYVTWTKIFLNPLDFYSRMAVGLWAGPQEERRAHWSSSSSTGSRAIYLE